MKYFLLTLIALFSQVTLADFQFHSLYEADGFVTEKLLPFEIKNTTAGDFSIEAIQIEKPCYGMIDPHRGHIIHIYCLEASNTSFSIRIRTETTVSELHSPSIDVKKVAIISSTPKPKDDGSGDSLGKQKFAVNCKSCHQAPYAIAKGVNKTILSNAFSGKPMRNGKTTNAMNQFNGFFSQTELDALVKYINEEL